MSDHHGRARVLALLLLLIPAACGGDDERGGGSEATIRQYASVVSYHRPLLQRALDDGPKDPDPAVLYAPSTDAARAFAAALSSLPAPPAELKALVATTRQELAAAIDAGERYGRCTGGPPPSSSQKVCEELTSVADALLAVHRRLRSWEPYL